MYKTKVNNFFKERGMGFECVNETSKQLYDILKLQLDATENISSLDKVLKEIALYVGSDTPTYSIDFKDKRVSLVFPKSRKPIRFKEDEWIEDIPLGIDFNGDNLGINLQDAVHVLACGETGSGKSIFLHNIVLNNLRDKEIEIIDPKSNEFSMYDGVNDVSVHTDQKEFHRIFKRIHEEMEDRFKILKDAGARDISEIRTMRRKILIVDEFSSMFDNKSIKDYLIRICSKSRACGIHVILCTQRASAKILSGDVKVNFPTRVCFKVPSPVDSRVILDAGGAENLIGKGEALCAFNNGSLVRFQNPFPTISKLKFFPASRESKISQKFADKVLRDILCSTDDKTIPFVLKSIYDGVNNGEIIISERYWNDTRIKKNDE